MSIYKGLFRVRSLEERDIITIRFESDKNGILHDTALTPKDINHKRQWAIFMRTAFMIIITLNISQVSFA